MSEKKVLFHPLERLDLIDVDALQAQVLDYLNQVLGNMIGRDQVSIDRLGGMLAKPSSTTVVNGVNNAYTISFSDFTYTEMNTEIPVARSRQSRIITFDASQSFHGTCDFSAARTIIQNYYNSQSALPPVGGGNTLANYQESLHGQYYPFVWAQSSQVNATQDTRRFWSVANGQETTSTVATRSARAVNFAVQYAEPSGEWVKVARVVEWSLNGSTVELASTGIAFLTLTDALVPLPTYNGGADEAPSYYEKYNSVNNASSFSGLLSCFKAIQNELALIRSGGTNDASFGSTLTNMTRAPRLSLDGLYDRSVDLQAQIRGTRQIGSAVFTLETNRPSGEYNFTVTNNTVISTAYPRVTLAGNPDYTLLFNKNTPPSTPLDFGGLQFDPSQVQFLRNWHAALSMFTVEVPASFVGYEIRVNPVIVAAVIDDYNTNNSTDWSVIGTADERFANVTARQVTDNPSGSAGYTDVLRVGTLNRKDENNADVSFTGVRIGLAGLDDLVTSTSANLFKVRIAVKVDVELVEI